MDATATVTVVSEVLELALKVGVPAVQSVIAAMGKDEITLADVQALRGLVDAAGSYFATTPASTGAQAAASVAPGV